MTHPDYRALCVELLAQALELIDTSPRDDATIIRHQELFDRARAALAMYSQDGFHSLEIRRIEVLPHYALLVPTP